MPAPCPGDADYPEGQPFTKENVERAVADIRDREADLRRTLDVSRFHPNAWDVGLRNLDGG